MSESGIRSKNGAGDDNWSIGFVKMYNSHHLRLSSNPEHIQVILLLCSSAFVLSNIAWMLSTSFPHVGTCEKRIELAQCVTHDPTAADTFFYIEREERFPVTFILGNPYTRWFICTPRWTEYVHFDLFFTFVEVHTYQPLTDIVFTVYNFWWSLMLHCCQQCFYLLWTVKVHGHHGHRDSETSSTCFDCTCRWSVPERALVLYLHILPYHFWRQ